MNESERGSGDFAAREKDSPSGRDLPQNRAQGVAGWIALAFVDSKLTPLLIVTAVLLGILAVVQLPREEEPQIQVPMIDVLVAMPGFPSAEVEERATLPMERLLWEIPGVEYVYSTSKDGEALVVVRFKVGESLERSLVRLNQKLESNFDRIPAGVGRPLVKPRSIDDVPILALTFHSRRYDHLMLRRLAAQMDEAVKQVPFVAETSIHGGARRQLRVLLDPGELAARNLSPLGILPMIQQANRQSRAGGLTGGNREITVETGAFLHSADDVRSVIVGVHQGRPVHLREVAEVVDGAEEVSNYVLFGAGAGGVRERADEIGGDEEPAVTLTIAKRPGANAITVAADVLRKVDELRGVAIPKDVNVTVTRHYGETAAEKSDELLIHMAIAVAGVAALVGLILGWRESCIVAVAIPVTLALTLLVFYILGYTLNRITLFALIFSIGILVDDAIVVVENVVRHFQRSGNEFRNRTTVAMEAVSEVGNPTILATVAVIFAVVPMGFVGGLMGPYMRPIPVGASAAMAWSLLIAFVVIPWAALRILAWAGGRERLRRIAAQHEATSPVPTRIADGPGWKVDTRPYDSDFFTRWYCRLMVPLVSQAGRRRWFIVLNALLFVAALATVATGWVKVKMLPFDNKSEFQIILNMPEGSSLERTTQVAREIAAAVRVEPEVANYQVYAGTSAPYNFNGLVRHYFLRRGSHVADLQVNLVGKHERRAQSHDVVKRVRPRVAAIAERYGARVALAEVPPGPPVLQTLVAEVYGPTEADRLEVAKRVRDIFRETPGVVDVDWYVESDRMKSSFILDKEKASLGGISADAVSRTLQIAAGGLSVDLLHVPNEKEDVEIRLELARSRRVYPEDLLALRLKSGDGNALPEGTATSGPLVPIRELVRVQSIPESQSRYRKNLMPVIYVTGDVAGATESPAYAIASMRSRIQRMALGVSAAGVDFHHLSGPFSDLVPTLKWDGEWHITLEVFRDLGLAFAAVLILIYVLMVGWFGSFVTPLVVMSAIPFSLVGILPAHGLTGAFFTATSMIGFMAGAGIVVRNSILLVDFIEQRLREGAPLEQAVIDAGAIRFRPMMLTAMAVVVGASVILLDPIFQGLAISLIAGEIASLLISRLAVPVLYAMVNAEGRDEPGREAGPSTISP